MRLRKSCIVSITLGSLLAGINRVRNVRWIDSSPAEYARIVAFEQDGYRADPVNNYDSSRHERVRYYFYSEETMTQWLE